MFSNETMSIILPARIVEYFPETQTADVQVCAEFITQSSSEHGKPVLRTPTKEVPVHTPFGGGWSITFPIVPGDTCLMVFSQQGYDHWLYNDSDTAGTLNNMPQPWLDRQFDEDDGFCLVGFNTLPRAIANYTMDGSQWRNADTVQNIHLKADNTIEVNTDVKVTINAPEVVINCSTANVVADTSVTLDTPVTTCTGNLQVDGSINAGANINATAIVGGATLSVPGPGPFSLSFDTFSNTWVTTHEPANYSGGSITGTAGALIASNQLTANGVTLDGHVHAAGALKDAEGRGLSGATDKGAG